MKPDSATYKNIMAIKQHSEETRSMLRDVEQKFIQIENLRNEVDLLKKQIQSLLVAVHSGRTTARTPVPPIKFR